MSDAFSAKELDIEVCGAYYREDEDNPDLIEAVVFETPDVEAREGDKYGEVAVKQRVDRMEENDKGIPQQKKDVLPKPGEVSEKLEELALKAQEKGSFQVRATVTELDRSKSQDMRGDEKIYFVNSRDVGTVQQVVFTDEEAEEEAAEA